MKHFAAALLALGTMCGCDFAFSTIGSWTTQAGPPSPITTNYVVALEDGRVAFFGATPPEQTGRVVLFDPATGYWTNGAPMPGPAYPDLVVGLHDGTVLLEGGADSNGNLTGATWLYDPTRNLWSQAGSVIEPRSFPSFALLSDGRLLIVGGGVPLAQPVQLPNGTIVNFQAVTTAEIFDPLTRTWSQAGHLAKALDRVSLAALSDGAALAAGGCQGDAGYTPPVAAAEVFDPVTLSWTATSPLPVPVCGATAVGLRDGRALIVDQYGFAVPYGFQFSSSDDSFVYDPTTRQWTAAGGLAGGGFTAVMLRDGRVFVPELEQGAPQGHIFLETVGAQIFDPSTNQWTYATTTQVSLPLALLYSGGGPPLTVALPDGNALVLVQTVTLAFHPQVPPPPTQVLDSAGLTTVLLIIAAVVGLLMLLAYWRAGRTGLSKLA